MKCFVISPIGGDKSPERHHADEVFNYLIAPALAEFGIEAVRSDKMSDPGRISDQMYKAIFEYDICIAVLTFANPNVYYELAVAQSAGRPVIALIDKASALPFDVKDFRVIDYDLSISSYEARTHIKRLVAFLERFKASEWRGEDVFAQYRSGARASGPLDITPFAVRITAPVKDSVVTSVRVEGSFDQLPLGYQLRTLRYYPDQHAFVPHGVVTVDNTQKKWWTTKFYIGGQQDDRRGIIVVLAGHNASILLDVWLEADSVRRLAVSELEKATGRPGDIWLPPIKRWPTDLIECDRVLVTRGE